MRNKPGKIRILLLCMAAVFLLPLTVFAANTESQQPVSAAAAESQQPVGSAAAQQPVGSAAAESQQPVGSAAAESQQPVGSAAQPMVSAVVSCGFDNNVKGGRYVPVHIAFSNRGENFPGNVSIFSKEADGEIYEYNYTVELAEGAADSVTYYVPVALDASGLLVSLRAADGTEIFREETPLNIEKNNAQLFVGILSDTPDSLNYLNDVSINYGLLRTKTFPLTTEAFPSEEVGLDLLDVILISNYRIRDLSELQSRALMDWVRDGGVMILGTGDRVDDTLGRYAPELLDDMYEEPEEMEIEVFNGASSDEPGAGSLEVSCADVMLHGGNIISKSNGLTVLASVNKESGSIIVAAYDFTDLAEFAGEHPEFAGEMFSRVLGSSRIEKLAGEMYGSNENQYQSVSKVVNSGDANRLPPIGIYALSILAYILLAGPGLYVFLKQRSLSQYYRMGVLALSVFFTIIIYMMGSLTRFEGTFYNYATVIDAGEDSVGETTYLNLRSPYGKSYDVSMDPQYAIYPVTNNTRISGSSGAWNASVKSNVRIARKSEETAVSITNVGAFASRFFCLERTQDNTDGIGFDGDVYLFGNEIAGEITNNFPQRMKNTVLLFYGHMVLIGDMEPGETISLNDRKVINIPLSASREVAEIISGLRAYDGETSLGSDYLNTVEKCNILEFYRDTYMRGYSADVRVLGFPENVGIGPVFKDDLEGYGMTVCTSSLPVDSRQEDRIYRSVLITDPVVISGNYAVGDNTMTATEPVILEYQLGNDLTLQDLVFEWIGKEEFSSVFEGRIAFYNYTTGAYDSIDTEKTVFTAEDLEGYRPPSNTLTVRYTYTGNVTADRIALPMVSLTGTEE